MQSEWQQQQQHRNEESYHDRNQWLLLLSTALFTFLFVGALYGWVPLQLLLENDGIFASWCSDDPNRDTRYDDYNDHTYNMTTIDVNYYINGFSNASTSTVVASITTTPNKIACQRQKPQHC
jgi:hypothetical protein